MLKKLFPLAVSAVLVVASSAVMAWPDVKLPGSSGSSSGGGGNALAMQDNLVKTYVTASSSVDSALVELATAYGLKDDAAVKNLTAAAFSSGAVVDTDALKKHSSASDAVLDLVKSNVSAGKALDDEGKKHFANSLLPYATGLALTAKMPNDIKAFSEAAKSQVQSASMLDKASVTTKLAAGTWLASEVPGYTTRLATGLKQIVTFATSASIPVPKDATDALAGL